MKDLLDIRLLDLFFALFIVIIPIGWLIYFKIKNVKSILIALVRMIIQLTLVGIYLEWIFKINNAVINSLWVIFMIMVGIQSSVKRIGLNWKFFVFPFLISSLTTIVIVDVFFLGFIIKLDYFFDARYFIPITGIILGSSLKHNIVGLTTYYGGLMEKEDLYCFILTNTANQKLALRPFIANAVKKGLNPLIANISVMGLISLPGMMTGQILAGSSPFVAIKYQILIILATFTGCSVNLFLSILFSNRYIFDDYQKLKEVISTDS